MHGCVSFDVRDLWQYVGFCVFACARARSRGKKCIVIMQKIMIFHRHRRHPTAERGTKTKNRCHSGCTWWHVAIRCALSGPVAMSRTLANARANLCLHNGLTHICMHTAWQRARLCDRFGSEISSSRRALRSVVMDASTHENGKKIKCENIIAITLTASAQSDKRDAGQCKGVLNRGKFSTVR